jgi:tetratricopeptide (TPR) repeat protein
MKFKDKIQRQEYIDNYILGKLDQKEIKEFESQLNEDVELHNEVEVQKLLIKEIHNRKKFLDIVAMSENKLQKKKKVTLYVRYSIAASFFILLSLSIWQPMYKSNSAVFSEYLVNPQITTQITRSNSSANFYIPLEKFTELEQKLISTSIQNFNKGSFDLVVIDLNKIDQIIEKSSSAGLMLAVSEINIEDFQDAREILNSLSENSELRIKQASHYYQGLILVKQGKTREARKIFRKLADQTGDYPDKAKEILKKMKHF